MELRSRRHPSISCENYVVTPKLADSHRGMKMPSSRPPMKPIHGLAQLGLLMGMASSCSSRDPEVPVVPDAREAIGTVALQIQVAAGVTLSPVSYAMSGPGGFSKIGTIDVTSSTSIAVTIAGIPAGVGYVVTTRAATVGGAA